MQSRTFSNRHDLPEPVCAVLTASTYSRGKANISVTGIIQSPRIRQLSKQHTREDISDLVWVGLGTAWHSHVQAALADYNPEWIVEQRYFVDVNGWVLSGQADLQTVKEDGTIHLWDWKVTTASKLEKGLSAEWEQQLNCYAYLIRRATGREVTSATVVAILRDYKRALFKRQQLGDCAVRLQEIRLWPKEQQESFVRQRVELHQEVELQYTLGEPLIQCTDQEQWRTPGKYAVMQDGRKRAKKVCDTQSEAEFEASLIKGGFVEIRYGTPLKCQANYCGVSSRCDQKEREALYKITGRNDVDDQYGE